MRGVGSALPGHSASSKGPDWGPDIRITATAEGEAVVPDEMANMVSSAGVKPSEFVDLTMLVVVRRLLHWCRLIDDVLLRVVGVVAKATRRVD